MHDTGFTIRTLIAIRMDLLECVEDLHQNTNGGYLDAYLAELLRSTARLGALLVMLKHQAQKDGIDWEHPPTLPDADIPF